MRVSANVTQAELAEALGVHWVTVSRWESGERRPRGDVAARYATALHELAEVVS